MLHYFRGTGLYPDATRFGLFTTEIIILHYWGEILTVGCMGIFMNPNLAYSVAALLQFGNVVISSGLLRYLSKHSAHYVQHA